MQVTKLQRKIVLLPLILLLWSVLWSRVSCTKLSKVSEGSTQAPAKHLEPHEVKSTDHQDKHPTPASSSGVIKFKLGSDHSHQLDFDFGSLLESLFQPFPPMFRDDPKKPKMKTVVSLTEVIGPKHSRSDFVASPFGFKESSLTDDLFDFPKMMPFVPKCSIIDVVRTPMKHNKFSPHVSNDVNQTDFEFGSVIPWHHHHRTFKRDMSPFDSEVPRSREMPAGGPKLFIKESDGPVATNALALGDIKLDQVSLNNGNAENMAKERINVCLLKYLPFVEGAIGGVMFVLLILFIASWRMKKPSVGGVWLNVPFLDKSQYVEKV